MIGPALDLRHRSFEAALAAPFSAAESDRQRWALLLEGAAVLALLVQAGWRLGRGWSTAGLSAGGGLAVASPEPGREPLLPQELLRDLIVRLFGDVEPRGRGEARKAIRDRLERWHQALVPISPAREVFDLLSLYPVLWTKPFAEARRGLCGELRRQDGWRPWVAAPAGIARRLLREAPELESLERLLAFDDAQAIWRRAALEEASMLAARGRVGAAVATWEVCPASSSAERLEHARSLALIGRPRSALAVLGELRSLDARLLRARFLLESGEPGAAAHAIRRLDEAELAPLQRVELAEVAVRALANQGRLTELGHWVASARRVARGGLQARVEVLAALAAWDQGSFDEMPGLLDPCRDAALADAAVAWRWRYARGLAWRAQGDASRALVEFSLALSSDRRSRSRAEAAGLWNEIGICRAALTDLAGAERAFRHTIHLLARSETRRSTTLGLANFAEIRLRRGRLAGVLEVVRRVTDRPRIAGKLRSWVHDRELWIRYELALGRARSALEHAREVLSFLDDRNLHYRREVLSLFAARALGWLGETEGARRVLEAVDDVSLTEIEPEERPAVFALAGERERALAEAARTPLGGLWQRLLAGDELPLTVWNALEALEPVRAARVVHDAVLLAPGRVPAPWLRRAVASFRRAGATLLAERLEAEDVGSWQAMAQYAESSGDADALRRVLHTAGTPKARLSWHREGEQTVLVDGEGGEQQLTAAIGQGRLVLEAPAIDAALRTVFALVLRDLRGGGPAHGLEGSSRRAASVAASGIVGSSPPLLAAVERLSRLANAAMPVLILGESGTGKELAARLVHQRSPRAGNPFLAMNCAAVSESLLLSDLFGHVRGAFTGADRDRAGIFEAVQGGTVFLDEIGDLPAAAQGMLLRVLQEGEVRRVGESLSRKVKVRVVAATHRDLVRMVADGTFRQDLYFRLKAAVVELPPLRARGDDILLLCEHFLDRFQSERKLRFSPAARQRLLAHDWPGNIRELENTLAVACALAETEGDVVLPEHLDLPADEPAEVSDYHRAVDDFRRKLLTDALAAARGNFAEAARRLGITRQAFSYLARQFHLTVAPPGA